MGNDPLNKGDPTGTEQGSYGSDGKYYAPGDRPKSEGKVEGVGGVVAITTGYAALAAVAVFAPAALPAAAESAALPAAEGSLEAVAVRGAQTARGGGVRRRGGWHSASTSHRL